MGREVILTLRLSLRQAELTDAAFFLELLNSPGWLKYIGDRGVYTEGDAVAYIRQRVIPTFEIPGLGSYLAVPAESDVPVGFVGVFRRPNLPAPDFGFAFLPAGQGMGYAQEASRALLARPEVQALPELLAITLPENLNSIRLLEQLGFLQDGKATSENGEEFLRYNYDNQTKG
ncbi:MAG: GNAT family N-acetyltransferase [Lewinella sp.]